MRVEGLDDLVRRLGVMDVHVAAQIAKKAVDKGAPIMRDALRNQVPVKTGSLRDSIRYTPGKQNIYGVFSAIGPHGYDEDGKPNAMKMNVLESGRKGGTSKKTKKKITEQKPRPVRDQAIKSCEAEIVSTMEKVVYEEIEKVMGK